MEFRRLGNTGLSVSRPAGAVSPPTALESVPSSSPVFVNSTAALEALNNTAANVPVD